MLRDVRIWGRLRIQIIIGYVLERTKDKKNGKQTPYHTAPHCRRRTAPARKHPVQVEHAGDALRRHRDGAHLAGPEAIPCRRRSLAARVPHPYV